MNLYKQRIVSYDEEADVLELIDENKSKEELMQEAVDRAKKDGELDIAWVSGKTPDESMELNVKDKYKLIIRSW